MLTKKQIVEYLKTKPDGYLYHRESNELEFKESFNLAALADYLKDFAGFANNEGGVMIFGVTDSPRKPVGLTSKSFEQFEKIDPEKITGFLLDLFNPDIIWEQQVIEINNARFGIFVISKSKGKPVIAKKDEPDFIKNGEIYYRYGGRTQKIQYSELQNIINQRIKDQNDSWVKQITRMSQIGLQNVALLDTKKGLIEAGKSKTLLIDESLLPQIRLLTDAENSNEELIAMKLSGEVSPVNTVEVIRYKNKNIIEEYPLTYTKLIQEIKKEAPLANQRLINQIIKENKLKNNLEFSVYVFKNKEQQDSYNKSGKAEQGIPSLYNKKAIDFIISNLK